MARKTQQTPEQALAALLAQQADIQAEIKRQQALVAKRAAEARERKAKIVGEAVLEILGDLPEAELLAKVCQVLGGAADPLPVLTAPAPAAEPAPAY